MSVESFGRWVRKRLRDAAPVVDGEPVPVLHENVPADGIGTHYHLSIRNGLSSPSAQGPTAERRFVGEVLIACRVPLEKGPDVCERLVDAIDSTYNRVAATTEDGDRVLFRDGGELGRGRSGAWFQITWSIPFQREVSG